MGNFKSKASENPQVKKIVDKTWDRFASTSEHGALGVQDLYCAILLVYNDINKKLPGPFNDPPTKDEVEELLRTFDKNQDGFLDRDEFTAFIATFTKNVSARVHCSKCNKRLYSSTYARFDQSSGDIFFLAYSRPSPSIQFQQVALEVGATFNAMLSSFSSPAMADQPQSKWT